MSVISHKTRLDDRLVIGEARVWLDTYCLKNHTINLNRGHFYSTLFNRLGAISTQFNIAVNIVISTGIWVFKILMS